MLCGACNEHPIVEIVADAVLAVELCTYCLDSYRVFESITVTRWAIARKRAREEGAAVSHTVPHDDSCGACQFSASWLQTALVLTPDDDESTWIDPPPHDPTSCGACLIGEDR